MSDLTRSRKPAGARTLSAVRRRPADAAQAERIVPVPGLVARRLATGLRTDRADVGQVDQADPAGLMVGRVDDPQERHADEVADRVMAAGAAFRPPVAALRRSAASTATAAPVVGAEGGRLDADLTGQINRKRGSGEKLTDDVRAGLGELSDAAGGVRIHHDADSDRLARSLSAKAFTVGKDVFFADGEYRPDTEEGQHTLAHEVAHAAEGGTDTHRIGRKYNLALGKTTGLMATENVRPFGPRTVWQFTDKSGDRIVVKMENQPLGLNDLATAVHKTIGKTDTIVTKPLDAIETQQARGVISDPRKATGPKWADAGADISNEVMGKMPADFNDPNDWGRWVTVHEKLLQTDPMIAMSVAPGESAEALLDVNKATAENAGTSPFKTVLERKSTTTKLGELSAIDIFLGNDDRVLGGNLGNWFYKPDEAMTVIDNVNQNMSDAIDTVEYANLPMLYSANLRDTAQQLADSMKRQVKSTYGLMDKAGKQSVDDWFNASADGSNTRMENVVQWMYEGLVIGRKRVIKTFSSSRFKNSSLRKAKKAVKKEARKATQTDQGVDYYDILKQRAKLVSKDGGRSVDPGDND
jgi:hypothetical protein